MSEFCEYIGLGGAVCMQPADAPPLDGELLLYCTMHRAIVARSRATQGKQERLVAAAAYDHQQYLDTLGRQRVRRTRSDPYAVVETDPWSTRRRERTRSTSCESKSLDTVDDDGSDLDRSPAHGQAKATEPKKKMRVRVRKIVIPPRFEVLDGSAAAPPQVWYVRLGEPFDPENGDESEVLDGDDDDYIEVDDVNDHPPPRFGVQ